MNWPEWAGSTILMCTATQTEGSQCTKLSQCNQFSRSLPFSFCPPPLPAVSHFCSIFLFFPLVPLSHDVFSVQKKCPCHLVLIRLSSLTQLQHFSSFLTSFNHFLFSFLLPSLCLSFSLYLHTWLFTFQLLSSTICWRWLLLPLSLLHPPSNASGSVHCTSEVHKSLRLYIHSIVTVDYSLLSFHPKVLSFSPKGELRSLIN